MAECRLKEAHGEPGVPCIESDCIYWRVLQHLDLPVDHVGCAIQYFGVLGDRGWEIAEWLCSVKERVEAVEHQMRACTSAEELDAAAGDRAQAAP